MIDNCHNCGGALVEQRRALSQCDGCGDHVVSADFIAACNPMVEKLRAERDQLRAELEDRRRALAAALGWTSDASWSSMTTAVRDGLLQNRRLMKGGAK